MISDQDTPHRFALSGIYNLPFGRGRYFLSDASPFVDRLVSGWQLNGTYAFQVGFPISFGTNLFYNGGDISIDSSDRTTGQWFNTSAFTSVLNSTSTLATPVSQLRTLPYRFSDVRRDNINDVNLSLIKDTRIRETMNLQLRFELINAFNEPYFPVPVVNSTATNFGQIAATAANQDNFARRVQIGVKFIF